MRVERCDFSGFRVYPAKGRTYVRGDSKVCLRSANTVEDVWDNCRWALLGERSGGGGMKRDQGAARGQSCRLDDQGGDAARRIGAAGRIGHGAMENPADRCTLELR